MIGPELVEKFRQEMTTAAARFEIISYPGAKHSFTNPMPTKPACRASATTPQPTRDPGEAMLKVFAESVPQSAMEPGGLGES